MKAVRLAMGIAAQASLANYNQENCKALAEVAEVIMQVMVEHWASFRQSASCQEIIVKSIDTLTDVEVIAACRPAVACLFVLRHQSYG